MLLDTDIMVDILRGFPPAVEWLESLGGADLGLPGMVAMELIQGERDRQGVQKILNFLGRHSVYWPQAEDCQQARWLYFPKLTCLTTSGFWMRSLVLQREV